MDGYKTIKCLPNIKTLNGLYDLKFILKGKRGAIYQIIDPYNNGILQVINSKGNFCTIKGNSFLVEISGSLHYR